MSSSPSFVGISGDRVLVNDDVFGWQYLPASIAVFGCGFVGLELGQSLHRLGVKTVILGKGGLAGPLSDPVVTEYTLNACSEEFYVDPDATASEVRREENQVVIKFQDTE